MIAGLLLFALIAAGSPAVAGSDESGFPPSALSFLIGGTRFSNDDLRDTYGSCGSIGMRFVQTLDERAEIILGIGYCTRRGRPFFDTPEFDSGAEMGIRIIPLEGGIRLNATSHPVYRFYFGGIGRIFWVKEEIRAGKSGSLGSSWSNSDFGHGILFAAGPEVRLPARHVSFGGEITYGPLVVPTGSRDRSLSGLEIRAHVSVWRGRNHVD